MRTLKHNGFNKSSKIVIIAIKKKLLLFCNIAILLYHSFASATAVDLNVIKSNEIVKYVELTTLNKGGFYVEKIKTLLNTVVVNDSNIKALNKIIEGFECQKLPESVVSETSKNENNRCCKHREVKTIVRCVLSPILDLWRKKLVASVDLKIADRKMPLNEDDIAQPMAVDKLEEQRIKVIQKTFLLKKRRACIKKEKKTDELRVLKKNNALLLNVLEDTLKELSEISNEAKLLKLIVDKSEHSKEYVKAYQNKLEKKHAEVERIDREVVGQTIMWHDRLCDDIWEGESLTTTVEDKLLCMDKQFIEDLKEYVVIVDVYIIGSLVNYSYNKLSNLDVCLIVDLRREESEVRLIKMVLESMMFKWNMIHNVIVNGHKLNVSIQMKTDEDKIISAGKYSILRKKWIKKPDANPPMLNIECVRKKYFHFVSEIITVKEYGKIVSKSEFLWPSYEKALLLEKEIQKNRLEGLNNSGEYSLGNVVFKLLKRDGYLQEIKEVVFALYNEVNSIDSR